jgi:undecaprenyl-diphosphatase
MNELSPLARVLDNWSTVAQRLRSARAKQQPVDWSRLALFVAAGLALVVFTAVRYDARVIAGTHTVPHFVTVAFERTTRLGRSDWLLIPSGAVVVLVALGDWRRVRRVYAAAWWEIASFAAVLFVVVAGSGLVTGVIKPIVGRSSPDYLHDGVFAFTPFSVGGYANYSFPSGHATVMAAVAVMAVFVPSVVTAPIVIAAAIVAISRVMIDVHFPSDVVGGVLVGFGVGYVILRLMADAGILFINRRDGSVRCRFGVLRRLHRRHRLGGLFPALRLALGGRNAGRLRPPGRRSL